MFEYTTPDESVYQVTTHVPFSPLYDPYLGCEYVSGPAENSCLPVFTGTFSSPKGDLALESSATTSPSSIGAGQSCSDAADSTASACTSIGPARATNSSEVTYENTSQAKAGIFLTKSGAPNPYTGKIIGPGDTWTVDIDPGVSMTLQNELLSGPTATIMITEVVSYGHDGHS